MEILVLFISTFKITKEGCGVTEQNELRISRVRDQTSGDRESLGVQERSGRRTDLTVVKGRNK